MSTPNAITATQGLLALIRASNGSIDSRIRLQKEAYLLKRMGFPLFQSVRFKYHYYGPYSRYLSACLQSAVADGLVTEHEEDFGNGYIRYSYTLPDDLEQEYVPEIERSYEDIITRLADEEWRTLELSATVLFLEEEEEKDEHEAMQRALALKPECKPFEEEAATLLRWLKKKETAVSARSSS
jgi:uncharacterized protein